LDRIPPLHITNSSNASICFLQYILKFSNDTDFDSSPCVCDSHSTTFWLLLPACQFWGFCRRRRRTAPQAPSQARRPRRRQGLARVENFEEVEPDRHKRSEGDPGSALPHAEQLYLRFGVSDDVVERALEGGVGRRRMIIAAALLHPLPPPPRCPKRYGDA